METVLANLEIVVVVALSFMFALLVEPVLLMFILCLTRRSTLRRKHPSAGVPALAEMKALATGSRSFR
ncbi:MAG: hypothetical protein JO187_05040 [Acidobacteria bacterium]|nr:hypothetical protein [Acidobacteriota bacterium]